MSTIFGIPADTLLIILLVAFAMILATGLWVFLRHRVVFRLGIRNLPRRPAQTILIVIGLMLSTTIIAAALTTGDIMQHSIRADVLEIAGYADELIVPATSDDELARPQQGVTFSDAIMADLDAVAADDPNIDGVMPMLSELVPTIHPAAELGEPALMMMGIDFDRLEPFGGLETIDGEPIEYADLSPNQVILGAQPAERLEAAPGDELTIFIQNQPFTIEVAAIAPDTLLTGMSDPGMPGGFAASLTAVQEWTAQERALNFIAVTNRGGVEDGVALTEDVVPVLRSVLEGTGLNVVPVKQSAIETAEEVASVFSSIFVVFGMFSIAAGILLIFLIFVLLAAERKPEMGISRALGMKRRQLTQMFMTEGLAYDLGAALIGALAGIGVAIVMVDVMTAIIGDDMFQLRPTASWRSLVIAYTLGVTVTFITIVISAWRVSRLNITSAVRNLPDPERKEHRVRGLILASGGLVFGILMAFAGYQMLNPFLFSLGISIVPFSIVFILQRFGIQPRPLYTVAALVVLFYWLIPDDWSRQLIPDMPTGDMDMFVLSGIMLVASSTVLIMWNAELVTRGIARASRRFSRWVPAVKTAISYPMANRGRTGLTIAMFSLIIFSLVMMASMNANFSTAFEGEHASAGWDVQVRQAPTNPIGDLRTALDEHGFDTADISATGRANEISPNLAGIRVAGETDWQSYQVVGTNDAFIQHATDHVPISIKADGYETSQDVWQAVQTSPNLAVVDSLAVPSPVVMMFGVDFQLPGLEWGDATMEPIDVEITNRNTGAVENVTIIGVIDPRVSLLFGIFLGDDGFDSLFPQPSAIMHYVAVQNVDDTEAVAESMESSLMTYGAVAGATEVILRERNEQSRGFLYLFEGFMALGLVVGIAALGVVSFRAVVERRQQIGMLRAIGYRRSMLSASFILESTMITGLGVLSGLILGLLLSWQLMNSEAFAGTLGGAGFIVPWGQLVIFSGIALVASLIMAWIPARQAARVPIAEALRYE